MPASRAATSPNSNRGSRRIVMTKKPRREQVHLAVHDLVRLIQAERVDDEEQVLGIEVDLRALPPLGAVLDRELVQRERVLEGAKLLVRGVHHVDPDAPLASRAPATISGSNGASSCSAPPDTGGT